MNLKINGEDIELVNSFRVYMYFEEIAGHNLDFANFTSNDLMILFYSVVIASLQKAKKPLIPFLEFLDIVDDNGGDKCVLDFSNFYIDLVQKQYSVIADMSDEKEETETEDPSKKKS